LSAEAARSGVVTRAEMLESATGSIQTVRQMPELPW
jgi:hypothetical protein